VVHLRRYFVALAIVLTMYGGYALGVVPLLQPPPAPPRPPVPPLNLSPVEIGDEIAQLFPPGSWELDKPKIVETEQATLLVQDYQPTPDGKLELTPCTLIFYASLATSPTPTGANAGAKPARRPIVMQAPQGAVLQFDRPLNIAKAEFGQLVGGRLPGEIKIFSPATAPNADDAIHLTTRNVQIEPTRVFTPHEVTFSFGKSSGRGRDLTIALIPKDPEAPAGSSGIGGVRSLTLARVDRLHIDTGESGILPTPDLPRSKGPAGASGPIHLTCQGPFVFDVTERMAMFDEQVVVERLHPAGPPDTLRCERLLLYLSGDETGTEPGGAESAAGQLQRIVAIGNPANLDAPSSSTRASAARIEYALDKRRLALLPSQNVPQISLGQQAGQFVARELEYEQAATGRLGRLWAAGPGQLTMVQTRGETQQTIVARWEKELRIRPQDETQVISLVEAASITADPLGRFSAGELHFWVRESTSAAAPGSEPKTTIVPEQLLATDDVRFDSPQLHAKTPRLEAFFQSRPVLPNPAAPADPIMSRPAPAAGRQPSLQKFEVQGELVRMQVLLQGEKIQLEDLIIRDRVRIDETRTAEPGQVPVRISGDLVTLRGGTTPQAQIDISGNPAVVGGRGMSLAGRAIHVRRGENRLWIDGPGEAQLPVPASSAQSTGAPPPPPQQATVVWQDGLVFDGLTAQLRGEVQARTATQVANCRTLDATLARRIDFAAPNPREPAELASLKLDGGVFLENRGLDEQGEQVSYDLAQLKNLTLDRASGRMTSDGPGWVSTTRASGAALPGAAARPMPANAAPAPAGPGNTPLTYVRIAFEKGIEGNLDKRTIIFHGDVKTTYSQVNDWKEPVIARQLANLGPRGVQMTSQALTVVEMVLPGQPRWIEISATGNVVVEGQSFTAQAPLVAYASDKEVLTLEGNGRADAELWYRDAPGQANSYASARKWRYWMQTGMFDVEDAKVFNLNQFQGGRIRLPGAQGFQ
jgi:hypothetical protein